MRFAAYSQNGTHGIAVAENAHTAFHACPSTDANYPGSLTSLVAAGPDALMSAGRAMLAGPEIDLDSVTLLPPLPTPPKIICVGLNYADHSAESGFAEAPSYPTLFGRFASSLIGAGAPIIRPRLSEQLDYEGEIVAVIGKGGRDISRENALDHVVAYSLFNDASIREYQFKAPQWTVGKNFDGTGPFGPYLVTADELPPGIAGLKLTTTLNGEVVQEGATDDLVFDVVTLIHTISQAISLEAGDIIVTGTPSGVGMARKPPLWMKPGDVVEVTVPGIGTLRNPVAAQA